MLLYNIRKARYAYSLVASGVANRWNKNNEYVIYAGGSRALSTLEMIVHRASIKIGTEYKLLTIDVAIDDVDILAIDVDALPLNWKSLAAYPSLQMIGSQWYRSQKQLVLKVPSVIIPQEFNYVINTSHPDFKSKVSLMEIADFQWDSRLL